MDHLTASTLRLRASFASMTLQRWRGKWCPDGATFTPWCCSVNCLGQLSLNIVPWIAQGALWLTMHLISFPYCHYEYTDLHHSPRWGEYECSHIHLNVNKVTHASVHHLKSIIHRCTKPIWNSCVTLVVWLLQISVEKESLEIFVGADHNGTRWSHFGDPWHQTCNNHQKTSWKINII